MADKRAIYEEDLLAALRDDPHINGTNFARVKRHVNEAPTVNAAEVVHGRWIKDGDVVVCSECGEEHAWDEYRASYCEDCGAKMDGDGNGE